MNREDDLYKVTYQCGWHTDMIPLHTWAYTVAYNLDDAENKVRVAQSLPKDLVISVSRVKEYIK